MEYLKSLARNVYRLMVEYPIAFLVSILSFVGLGLAFLKPKPAGGSEKNLKNDVVPERKEDGKPIPIGTSDSKGWVQVEETKENPSTPTLPVGVEEKSVAEVIEIKPNIVQTQNNDTIADVSDIIWKLKK